MLNSWKAPSASTPPPPKRERPKLTALGPNDRPPEAEVPVSSRAVGADSKCGSCGTKWIEDQTACPVCGASISEMVGGPSAKDEASDPISTPVSSGTPGAAAPRVTHGIFSEGEER